MDYDGNAGGHTLFRPLLNGREYATPYGVAAPTNLTPPGAWYVCANSPGAGRGGQADFEGQRRERSPCLIDDVVVTGDAFAYTRPAGLLMLQ